MTKRKTLRKTDLIAIQDTREKTPVCLDPLRFEVRGLPTGDYSLRNAEHLLSIERKSLGDLVLCCTHERPRFKRELERLREFKYRAIVVESNWDAIELKFFRGAATPSSIFSSALSFAIGTNCSLLMADNHARAGKMIARLIWISASKIHNEGEADIIFREPGDEDEQGMGASA